jgi:hypothetical protein
VSKLKAAELDAAKRKKKLAGKGVGQQHRG